MGEYGVALAYATRYHHPFPGRLERALCCRPLSGS